MDKPIIERAPLHVDDRGSVYCPFDHNGDGDVGLIKRTYVVQNWKVGMIRAWHGHRKGWTGMHVIHGAAKLVAVPIEDEGTGLFAPGDSGDAVSVVLSDKNPGILWIPPGYFNGSITLVDNTKILVYSTLTFDEVKQDDVRGEVSHWDKCNYFDVRNR